MTLCYLGLGSNLKCPERQLRQAIDTLKHHPKIQVIRVASFYANKAWGRRGMPAYRNTVVAIHTSLSCWHLLKTCQKIEKNQGRVRKIKWSARTLDIDILLFGTLKMDTPELTIPHPRMHQRDFVLVPLQELIVNTPILD